MKQFATFPPRLAFGGFPAFTTLVGTEGSVKSHKDSQHNICVCLSSQTYTEVERWLQKQKIIVPFTRNGVMLATSVAFSIYKTWSPPLMPTHMISEQQSKKKQQKKYQHPHSPSLKTVSKGHI